MGGKEKKGVNVYPLRNRIREAKMDKTLIQREDTDISFKFQMDNHLYQMNQEVKN